MDTGETRADIARRRLAQLAAAFDDELPPADPPPPPPSSPSTSPTSPDLPSDARPSISRLAVALPHVRVIGAVAVAAAVLLVWWLLSQRPESAPPIEPVGLSSSAGGTGEKSGAPAELVVDVVGEVKKPGVVTVPRGSRVHEAIAAAGGLKGRVDTSAVNLARKLEDGEQIVIGGRAAAATVGGAAPGAGGSGAGGSAAGKVNLNQATLEQLDELPGVGPVTAQAIISWREENGRFSSVDDLLDVKGIGDATLAELRDLVTV